MGNGIHENQNYQKYVLNAIHHIGINQEQDQSKTRAKNEKNLSL